MEGNSNSTKTRAGYKLPEATIFEKLSDHKDVSLVYGEPIELEKKKILPVAKAMYFGGGGGGYTEGNENTPFAEGGGGGGHYSTSPIGVYEITAEKTTFKPVIDVKLILIFMTLLTFGLVWLLKRK